MGHYASDFGDPVEGARSAQRAKETVREQMRAEQEQAKAVKAATADFSDKDLLIELCRRAHRTTVSA